MLIWSQEIMRICQLWTVRDHLDVEDIQEAPIFQRTLAHLYSEFNTPSYEHFRAAVQYVCFSAW